MSDKHEDVVDKMIDLYHMLICHNGYGEMSMDIQILKRGQKEVILRCGKQYRFVVDTPRHGDNADAWILNWKHDEDKRSCQNRQQTPEGGAGVAEHALTKGGESSAETKS